MSNEIVDPLDKRGTESELIGLELFLGIAKTTAEGIISNWTGLKHTCTEDISKNNSFESVYTQPYERLCSDPKIE